MPRVQEGSRLIINADNRAALIVIVTAVGLSWTLLTLIIRVVSRLHVQRSLGLEEILVIAASGTAAVSSACVLGSIHHGLGQRDSGMVDEHDRAGLKLLWISETFYLLTLGIAKVAALPLLLHLTRIRKVVLACYALGLFTLTWVLVAVPVVASRCLLSAPWDDISSKTCPSLYGRWIAIETVSLIIEILMFILFVSIIKILKMKTTVKIKVIIAFSTRLPVIAPTVLRLNYLRAGINTEDDTVFALTNAVIATQTVLHYTTMAASFAYLKPFLRAFDSNLGATINVDTMVSSGYVYQDSTDHGASRSEEHGKCRTPTYPLRPLHRNGRVLSGVSEEYTYNERSMEERTQRNVHLDTDVAKFESRPSTAAEYNYEPHSLDKKYTSRESMTPMITKTQEWHVRTETRNSDHRNNQA